MERIGIPEMFRNWFWSMYEELFIVIVLNKFKSGKIYNERGFMEGHPPSMAAFVISIIPMMTTLEEILSGIATSDGKCHKIKMFTDDLKVFLKDPCEIDLIYDVITKFERISGLVMHRDPKREKCQALPFGSHREYQG